jgi:hypothetical protein
VRRNYLFASILILSAFSQTSCGSVGQTVSESDVIKAFKSDKALAIQSDPIDKHKFFKSMSGKFDYLNSDSLGILDFGSASEADSHFQIAKTLIEEFAPGQQIFKCGNLIGDYDIKFESSIEKTLSPWCSTKDKTLNFVAEKPFLGFLQSYIYKTSGSGLFSIINPLKGGGYRSDFYDMNKSKNLETHLGFATFTEQGGGLLKVIWESGETNIAQESLGSITFECPSSLSPTLSRADCMLQNSNTFNENISFLTSLNGNRLLNEDSAGGDVGLLMVFNKKGSNQYIATEYAQAQNGSIGEVTSASMVDLGFGHAIGKWDNGVDALYGYLATTPPIKLKSGAQSDGFIKVNCSDDSAAAPKGFYVNSDSCTFYSIHK